MASVLPFSALTALQLQSLVKVTSVDSIENRVGAFSVLSTDDFLMLLPETGKIDSGLGDYSPTREHVH